MAEVYEEWTDLLIATVDRNRHTPVYRMADGEFMFAVGHQSPVGRTWLKRMRARAARSIRAIRNKDVETIWGERYARREMDQLRREYVGQVGSIAQEGFLAVHFIRSPGGFGEEYIDPVSRWFDVNGIELSRENFVPFYFVYALLNGPKRFQLYRDRRILVVTSADSAKQDRIQTALIRDGARFVEFYGISSARAMTDCVEVERVRGPVDLVLVGAGIGSANILVQLSPLEAVCIDAGIAIECLADPQRKRERIFLLNDEGSTR
jgi:hypothetical protein